MMIKKLLFAVFALALVSSFVAFTPNQANAEKVELRLMVVGGGERAEYMKKMFEEFTTEHPDIEINLEIVAGGGAGPYQESLQTGMASGTGPDVFFEWGGELAG